MQNLNAAFPSIFLTQASENSTHSSLINLKLKSIDDEIEKITQNAKEKGIDIHNTSWMQEMRAIRAKASQQIHFLLSFGSPAETLDRACEKAFGELHQIRNQISTGISIATDVHLEAGKAHRQFQTYLKAAEPELLLSVPNDIFKTLSKQQENDSLSALQLFSQPYDSEEEISRANASKARMDLKKSQLARCVQMSIDSEFPGRAPCLEHHLKDLSEAEQNELSDFELKAVNGAAINNLAVLPALVSAVGSVVQKGLMLSAAGEAAMTLGAANYEENLKEFRKALEGENPEYNRIVKEMTPACVQSVQATFVNWNSRLDQYDLRMQEEYRTYPGIVKEGLLGVGKSAVAVGTGLAFKGIVSLGKTTGQAIKSGANARRTKVKSYRIEDSKATYSDDNSVGRKIVVKEKHKTYYEHPQAAHKPFKGIDISIETPAKRHFKPLLLGNHSSSSLVPQRKLKKSQIFLPEGIYLKDNSSAIYSAANSNLLRAANRNELNAANRNSPIAAKDQESGSKQLPFWRKSFLVKSQPTEPQNFVNKIFKELSISEEHDLHRILADSFELDCVSFIPILNPEKALHKLRPFAKKIYFEELTQQVSKATIGSESFIIKKKSGYYAIDSICELVSIDFMHSLKLRRFHIPEVLYAEDNYLIKTCMPGKTFEEMMMEIGSMPIEAGERKLLFKELREGSYQAGKAIAELQNQSFTHSVQPENCSATSAISTFKRLYAEGEKLLSEMDPSLKLPSIVQFDTIFHNFLLSPGAACYGIKDISGSQFVWCARKKQLSCIDLEFVSSTFTMKGKPMGSAQEEYWQFVNVLDAEALGHKLTTKETGILKSAFEAGYISEYKGPTASAADLFFRLFNEVNKIFNMSELALESVVEIGQKKLVVDLVHRFNEVATAVTAPTAEKPFLNLICWPETTIIKTYRSEKMSTQGYYNYVASILSDGTTVAFISGISNGTYTIKPEYTHDAGKGFLTQSLHELKQEALNQGSKRLIIEFEIKNEKLFELLQKCYPYLGQSEMTHLGIKLDAEGYAHPRHLHRFKVSLELPTGSLMEDRRLWASRLVD